MAVPETFADRLRRARGRMAQADATLMIVDHAELLAYLTGYTVSETRYRVALIPLEGAPWIVLRSLDADPCRRSTWIKDIIGFADDAEPHGVIAASIRERGYEAARIGADFNSYGFTVKTRERLCAALPRAEFVDMGAVSDELRLIKTADEMALLRRAAAVADGSMEAVRTACFPGMTAREAAAAAAAASLRLGADTGETGPIVKAAGDSDFLHAFRLDEPLAEGDILHVELIPRVAGYSARLMRPVLIGADRHRRTAIAERLVALQDAQFAAMRPGTVAADVDRVLRESVLEEGLRAAFDNVSGYTLGLYGRTPRTSDFSRCFLPNAAWRLEAGMTFHMYVSAQGIAFSDTVAVTPQGPLRLTQTPRTLLRSDLRR